MKRNLAPETKVAGGGAAGAIVTIVLLLNGWQHWFTPPPADVTAALTAALATAVAYVLPHTHLRPDTSVTSIENLTRAVAEALRSIMASEGKTAILPPAGPKP